MQPEHGEWLNRIIYSAGEGEISGGEVEGLKLRDIVTAIEHLSKKISSSESQNLNSLNELKRNLGGVVERLQRLERTKASGATEELASRVAALEEALVEELRVDGRARLDGQRGEQTGDSDSHDVRLQRLDPGSGRLMGGVVPGIGQRRR